MSRVLITGASGFVGSVLVDQCRESGFDVIGVARHMPPAEHTSGDVRYVQLDLNEPDRIHKLVRELKPEIVFHLAAQSSTSLSWQDPVRTYRDNVMGQLHVLEACRAFAPSARILVTGSSDEYGAPPSDQSPISEDQPLAPLTPYGVTKVAQDLMACQYFAAHGLQTIVVRPFLQVGPGRSDAFFSGAFARQIVEIELARREPVIEVGEIDRVRDLTDVRDVATACLRLISTGEPGTVYNIASGRGRPVRDLLKAMLDIAGIHVPIHVRTGPERAVEPNVLVGDATRLRKQTGWVPTIPLEQSASDMLVDWRLRLQGHR